jgi:hypothetical protein
MIWLDALKAAEEAPTVLATALALDAWLALEPAERGGEVGFGLAATILRQRDIAAHHLQALGLGYRVLSGCRSVDEHGLFERDDNECDIH